MELDHTVVSAPTGKKAAYELSPACEKFIPAFVLAVNAIKPAKKQAENPYFKAKYADLAACAAEYQPALASNDLALAQFPSTDLESKVISITTAIFHSSGQWLRTVFEMPFAKLDPQDLGKHITYARRYALACLGLVTEEDDDGNSGTDRGDNKQPQPQRPAPNKSQQPSPAPQANKPGPPKPVPVSNKHDDEIESLIVANTEKHNFASKEKAWRDFLETNVIGEGAGLSKNLQIEWLRRHLDSREAYQAITKKWRLAKHKPASFSQALSEAIALPNGAAQWIAENVE